MNQKQIAGEKAAEYIKSGMIVGLGTGSTAFFAIKKLGERVREEGLEIQAVATSKASADLAVEEGIPLLDINDVDHIDIDIDGVDEIDPEFNAIKGGGGALFREKVVADLSREVIWIMDASKPVDAIGAFHLPVEILPYGYVQTLRKMEKAGISPVLRKSADGNVFVTDNGNYIADLHLGKPIDIPAVKNKLSLITGVLETGFFLNYCKRMIVGTDEGPVVIENPSK